MAFMAFEEGKNESSQEEVSSEEESSNEEESSDESSSSDDDEVEEKKDARLGKNAGLTYFTTIVPDVMEIIQYFGLDKLVHCTHLVNLDLCKEFYTNLHPRGSGGHTWVSRVGCVDIEFTPSILQSFLECQASESSFTCFPTVVEPFTDSLSHLSIEVIHQYYFNAPRAPLRRIFNATRMSARSNILYKVVIGCILPIVTRGQAKIRLPHLVMMYALEHRLDINIALHVFESIVHFSSPSNEKLYMPYCHILTSFFASRGLDVMRGQLHQLSKDYDQIGARQMSLAGIERRQGEMVWRAQEADDSDAEEADVPPPALAPHPVPVTVEARLTQLEETVRQGFQEFRGFRQDWTASQQRQADILRKHLFEELDHAFPDEVEMYREIRTSAASQSSRHFEDNDSEEIDQISEPQSVTSISKAPPIILVICYVDVAAFSFLEGIAFNGIGINLVLYLGSVLHWPISSSAANVSFWGGTTYFTPLLGGLLADTYLGNYRTIVISIILYLLVWVGDCYFICHYSIINTSFMKWKFIAALLPFGADQFNEEKPIEMRKKVSFFSYFYVCSMLGVLFSASGGFLLGTSTYKLTMPTGSPLKSLLQVIVATGKDNDPVPRKEKKREARREEKPEKAAVIDMVFRRCTGYLEDAQVEKT
ncbi:hypothetical protein ZIOFF_013117 [Zingiber officinale]|uniref:Uncharacterized protein n=1 Tax=Zingiber officinale TaxID=94328 RepID=A0A8J5LTY6_ZINOF|nr:hypothetical protein ZIOFF_013117 [Zingiber officinale]